MELQKILSNIKKPTYIFLDINSLTVIPNLFKEIYLSHDRINITPFIETIKLYFKLVKVLGYDNIYYFIVYDTGISSKILKIYPKYKEKRRSRKISKNISKFTQNVYDYNISLIDEFFKRINEISINDLAKIEADFVIGYFCKKLKNNTKLVISHDKDLLMAFDNKTHVIYKYTSPKSVKFIIVNDIEDICQIMNFEYLQNTTDLLFYRALIGDKSDGIEKPFGITRITIVNNLFKNAYLDDVKITYDYIIKYFSRKFKTQKILDKFTNDLNRNIFIMNIFNDKVFTDGDKLKLNLMLENINNRKQREYIDIDLIYNFFDEYGLYYTKSEMSNIFRTVSLIN